MNARELLELVPARHALRVVDEEDLPVEIVTLPDLSVTPERKRPLMRSYWAAVVVVTFAEAIPDRHAGLYTLIGSHLKNRTAVIEVEPESVRVDFQVEDGTPATRSMVQEFSDQLRVLLGAEASSVVCRVNDLDPVKVDAILRKDPPDLKAL